MIHFLEINGLPAAAAGRRLGAVNPEPGEPAAVRQTEAD
jgi:hypothetical protein